MLPVIIPQQVVRPFSVYFNGTVRQGISYRGTLYQLNGLFSATQRSEVYSYACQLSNQHKQILVTVAPDQYGIWVDFRSETVVPAQREDFH